MFGNPSKTREGRIKRPNGGEWPFQLPRKAMSLARAKFTMPDRVPSLIERPPWFSGGGQFVNQGTIVS